MTSLRVRSALADQLLTKLQLRTATVAVVGLGYVGLPLAETFAWGGYGVQGFDIDPKKVEKLNRGESYIRHIPAKRVGELVETGRFHATCDEACFADPDNFDVTRNTQKSIAFGAGPHYCAGAFASRAMVADVALPGIFARLKGLRLDPREKVRIGGWAFRGLLNLPVEWDA